MIKKIIITVKEQDLDRLEEVSGQLIDFDMKLENTMKDFGLIMGQVDEQQIQAINHLSWVESVEEDEDVNLY